MLRSLYSGISGLQGHQQMMDVIGNNIANVNTIGFKGSRMTFQDAMSQTLSYGNGPVGLNGGVNPKQIGLGMTIGSIDTNFGQGVMQTTGMSTDLAIQGDGFFVVSDGNTNSYTRAGAFQLDAQGNLLAQGGKYFVQGRMADANGDLLSGTPITNIQLPFGEKYPAKATDEMKFHCNLDASKDAKQNTLAADWGMPARVEGAALNFAGGPITLTQGETFSISTNDVALANGMIVIPETSTCTNLSQIITALNSAIRTNPNLANKVTAVVNETGDGVSFKTTAKGGSNTTIEIADGTWSPVTVLGIGTATGNGTVGSNDINTLPLVTTNLTDGDTITISGSNPDGTPVTATFTYGAAGNGTTVDELLAQINSVFTGATATLDEKGKIVLTDAIPGASKSAISMSFNDIGTADPAGSAMAIPSFSSTQKGVDAGSHTASIYTYDSLGNKHTVEITFTKNQGQDNYWNWEAKVDGGEITASSGSSGFVSFNDDGSIARMEALDGQKLSFAPGQGADTMEIELNGGASGSFSGITQYSSPFTTIVSEQNGYTMGILSNVTFDETGKIVGEYTNGQNRDLAQVALATFTNENGLLKSGDNLYKASTNSGSAAVGMAGEQIASSIASTYLEASNVDLSKELTDMIIAQRGYQANTKVITTVDTMLTELIQIKR